MAVKTLTDLISHTNRFDIKGLSFFDTDQTGITTVQTTQFDRYRSYVMTFVDSFDVQPEHRELYKFRPALLSKVIYGEPNLDWLIMKLNNCESASRFILHSKVKLIDPTSLENLLQELRAKDKERIEENWLKNGII